MASPARPGQPRGGDADGVDAVGAAMRQVPRRDFLPRAQRLLAGRDGPLPIGHGQTSSQPRTVAAMLRLLDVRAGHHVLDVGAGSGWTTALLAHLVGARGSVVGVELEPELAARAEAAVRTRGTPWALVRVAAAGVLGHPAGAPYDRVLVSAMAGELPEALVSQLAPGGVMVVPVAGEMLRVVAAQPGERPLVTRHGAYRFVPLR